MIKKFVSSVALFGLILLSNFGLSHAQVFNNVCNGGNTGESSICQQKGDRPTSSDNPFYGPNGVITKAVNIISIVAGVAAVILIIVGGVKFALSSGDSAGINSAKNTILFALIGLVIVALAQGIVRFVLSKL
jgi:hypothetical protein